MDAILDLTVLQDNDIERAVNLNRDHLDYIVEETWRWAMACELCIPCCQKNPCMLTLP